MAIASREWREHISLLPRAAICLTPQSEQVMRDELFNGEIFYFYTLQEARIIIEQWRRHYLTLRPHSIGPPPT